ncbi:MAG: sulfotransferase [Sphingobium sp.]
MARLVSEGLALLQASKPGDVLTLIARACPDGPSDPRLLVQKGYAHTLLGHAAQALAAATQAMATPPSELWALDLLGNIFTLCHRPGEAYAAFALARRAAPDRPDVLFNLATAAGFLGLEEEAERAYDQVIGAAPDHAEAYLNRSLLRRQTAEDNHISQLSSALETEGLPWQREVYLRYALGKELEDLGDYDGAFANIARGAAVRRQHMQYAVSQDIDAMALIAEAHDATWCAPAAASRPGAGPTFIMGLPRSGSTLLERMLGQHSQVQSLGELQYFGQALVAAFHKAMGRMPTGKEELIRRSVDCDVAAIGDAYLSMAPPLRNGTSHFIDKLPINFLYAGLIARALPSARLVHIRRHPLDLCFAMFKTMFGDAYPFSYSLEELGAYYHAYDKLMAHWRRALGDRLIEIDYEDLVGAPGATLETLLPALGLGFEEACLSPEKDRSAVMTASASQVRRPIHLASVGSAARYARHLGPLRSALRS